MSKKILFIAFACIFALPLSVGAAGTSEAGLKAAIKGAISRCPIIESKIQIKVGSFDNSKVKQLEVYANIKAQLLVLADKLSAKGIDVTALKADLAVLDQKIQKFNADYAAYIVILKDSQTFACGKSQGLFLGKLKDAKTALQKVNADAKDIRSYYVTVLRVEVMKIREALNAKASTTPEAITVQSSSTAN